MLRMSKRFSILLVVLTIVSGLIGGAITGRIFTSKVAKVEETKQSKMLSVEELRIVDKDGETKVIISTDDGGNGTIFVVGKDSKPKVAMWVDESRGNVILYGEGGKPVTVLTITEDGGVVNMSDKDGNPRICIGVNDLGDGGIGLFDRNGNQINR